MHTHLQAQGKAESLDRDEGAFLRCVSTTTAENYSRGPPSPQELSTGTRVAWGKYGAPLKRTYNNIVS